jgi:methanogenic corrinoid protein MtbC1
MVNMNDISLHLQHGRARETSALTDQAIAENYPLETIINQGFIPGLKKLEEQRRNNEILFPEISLAVRALNRGIGQIRLALAASPPERLGTVIAGAAEGDTEETAKNIIAVLLESRGFRVVDLGSSVKATEFVRAAKDEKARIILCSAALVTTMAAMKDLVQAAAAAGIRNRTKIMLTGTPVTERYCRLIGADLYAPDALSAAELASSV